MIALVGYTGFVGSNIYLSGQKNIDKLFNSKNIEDAYGLKPDLLIYAGIRAEKYLANTAPDIDMNNIIQAEENIKRINPKRLVLISTVDVFKDSEGKYENADIDVKNLHPYGLNRYQLEQWVREYYKNSLIIRLPALYGINIKKNFIYDFINIIPFMIREDKFRELSTKNQELIFYYELQTNGFYKLKDISEDQKKELKKKFKAMNFTALNFTDSRNVYQFYPLNRLWADIMIALANNIDLLHMSTEPLSVEELYNYITGKTFKNEFAVRPTAYNFKSIYAEIFGGKSGYIINKKDILKDIKKFVSGEIK